MTFGHATQRRPIVISKMQLAALITGALTQKRRLGCAILCARQSPLMRNRAAFSLGRAQKERECDSILVSEMLYCAPWEHTRYHRGKMTAINNLEKNTEKRGRKGDD
jgi:hypothetical protein